MDESSSLSQEADSDGAESAAEWDGKVADSSSDDTGELSQEEIEEAFDAVNGSGGESGENNENSAASNGESKEVADSETSDPQSALETETEDHLSDDGFNIVKSKEFENFGKPELGGSNQKIDMLLDVTLPISIELGRTSMPIEDILNLGPGSVVELNRLAGEPVDLLVNDKLIARGEVVVVDENFGVRVTTMVSHEERLRSLA
ncbi:MAG: flagellar motor switch protein FliN [Candidatus Zixiibacteriota bacterium]|nr:MAG: flagellar motor switch protein FliN [candidate division Zixibacteria bacterium]